MAQPIGWNQAHALLPGLPPYAGGRMSDTMYHAGYGLHPLDAQGVTVRSKYYRNAWAMLEEMQRFVFNGFDLSCTSAGPAVFMTNGRLRMEMHLEEGQLVRSAALCGQEIRRDSPTWVRTVTETSPEAFEAYVRLLESEGFAHTWSRELDGNLFVSLTRSGRNLYAAYYAQARLSRWIDDPVSSPLADFCTPGGNQEALLCQYGLHYGKMKEGVSADCGMLYFLRLKDGTLFVIDGGMYEQATDAATADMLQLMHELTGTAPGEKIPIAAWFCTHAHDDHMDGFCKMLRFHHDEMDVQRVIFNFPEDAQYPYLPAIYLLFDRLAQYYPHVRYLKAHTGQHFELGGVAFDVLLTHEDSTAAHGDERIGTFNDTSTVLRASVDGVRFLCLGDMYRPAEALLLGHFQMDTIRSNAIQVAHHMINQLDYIYAAAAPEVALVPQSADAAADGNIRYRTLCSLLPEENIHFASAGTQIFVARDGRWQLREVRPSCQEEYDGSAV